MYIFSPLPLCAKEPFTCFIQVLSLLPLQHGRQQRRKWVQCFEFVAQIIFCVAPSEYGQPLTENPTQHWMEPLALFDSVMNPGSFFSTSF
ncbi:uncharacterized protein EI90DRAFT_3047596 [Cantharellus anzutake]|uniref:uncharacterized protein n=1 Tax=Cantharellus anzutake TaxID=1750568 RepID=UPI001903AEBB|nr:uncharacterized protein EI90DRAFT_3047596 [Cantharellus anzutake]KAF8335932.1 hypothetical protein EI90DRAFT_3047596 [Cantharellus anzutake]